MVVSIEILGDLIKGINNMTFTLILKLIKYKRSPKAHTPSAQPGSFSSAILTQRLPWNF